MKRTTHLLFALVLVLLGSLALAFALAADSKPPAATGSVRGVLRFTGAVPPAQVIMTTDGGVIHHHDLVVDAKTKGLRYVAALLEDAPAQPKVEKAKAVLMDQQEMLFVPRVVAVRHGQPVRFDNSDLCNHSVQAVSTTEANQFNRFAVPGQPIEHLFELQKRPVVIGCSLHSWMRAWVYVVPHPWFAVTDKEGRFEIKDIPAGKYTLRLHHADTSLEEKKTVQVEAGKTIETAVEWTTTKKKPD